MKRKNPFAIPIIEGIGFTLGSKVTEKMIGSKKKKKKKRSNPSATGSFIPVRISGNKLQMRIPNRNPGTLKQVKDIAKRFGIKQNPKKADLPWLESYPASVVIPRMTQIYKKYGQTIDVREDMETLSKAAFNKKYPIRFKKKS